MKETKKNYIFSNFNTEIFGRRTVKNDLNIESIYNLKTENGSIEPVCNYSNFFQTAFKNDYNIFINKNSDIVNKIIYATIYEFEDDSHILQKRIFVIDTSLYLYEIDTSTYDLISLDICFNEFPNILKQNGNLYFFSYGNNFVIITKDNIPINLTAVPDITNINNCGNNTYFTVKNDNFNIYYTENTELENLSNELESYDKLKVNPDGGIILSLVAYKNCIYIVQQYCISKLNVTTKEIALQMTCAIKSKIFPNTVCLIDDYIVFLSTAGLFIFDGNDIKQVFKNITQNLCGNKFKAISHNNRYYLLTNIFINDISNNILLEFDIENNNCIFNNIGEIDNIYEIEDYNYYELLAVINNQNNYEILHQTPNIITQFKKYIKFNKVTFDDKYIKILNHLKISCFGSFNLKISSEIDEVDFNITDNFEAINVGLKGQAFTFEIFSDKSFCIESIYIGTSNVEE